MKCLVHQPSGVEMMPLCCQKRRRHYSHRTRDINQVYFII
ncbi:hypothetical protein T11_12983 [Trichinella zimbabwensis]|uniref:Uncharacterized protein n=1 Tax=Trichinella zimbabwensis TaxID=268475 RepID=A0A0V1DR60_9BILA|nr:hypothetical protein T11_12983 [Trichinella zimbabwensis]